MNLSQLRTKHPRFIYDSYNAQITDDGLRLTFNFFTEPNIEFHPTVTIKGVTKKLWSQLSTELQQLWIFHLGLAEIPSYWKATASPEIIIRAGYLSEEQVAWWNELLIKGMGEYFYLNQIDFTTPDFIAWKVDSPRPDITTKLTYPELTTDYLVPIGGGKDSSLTICLLDKHALNYDVFMLNPTPAMKQIAQITSPQRIIEAQRVIDPSLLELNQQGYLNGHVPFSAYLGFLSRLAGVVFGQGSVVISNERSSNEGNTIFHDQTINHQYSKTYEFECNFDQYLKQSGLIPTNQSDPAYFSILRPLYELQISQLFLKCPQFDQYAAVFRSCNRGQKTNTWCGECPKCLFAFISFYPFATTEKLVQIFGQNLLAKESLLDEALALLGKTKTKPFECVGTHEENIVAFYLAVQKHRQENSPLPILLEKIWQQVLSKEDNLPDRAQKILQAWNSNHQIPAKLEAVLQDAIQNFK